MSGAHIIVGAIVEKGGKYLMVQELKKKCYMQWNLPLGHLDPGEKIEEGAIREVKEETGYDVELTGLVDIINNINNDAVVIRFAYAGKIVGGDKSEKWDDEINDVQWFSLRELEEMGKEGKLRGSDALLESIRQYEKKKLLPTDLVKEVDF